MKKIIVLCICMLVVSALPAMAQVTITVEEPEVLTAAEEAISGALDPVISEVERAEEVLRDIQKGVEVGTATEAELEAAEGELAAKQGKLNRTKVEALAENSSLSVAQIESMRASGMGWGRIAKEAGVHPSVLGTGKSKAKGKDKDKGKFKNNGDNDVRGSSQGNKNKKKNKGKGKK